MDQEFAVTNLQLSTNSPAKLSIIYGYKVTPPHDDMITISCFLRRDPARIKDVIELLQMNRLNFPASAVNEETLGDTQLAAGDKENALKCFQKALSLDPKRQGLEQKIKELEKEKGFLFAMEARRY